MKHVKNDIFRRYMKYDTKITCIQRELISSNLSKNKLVFCCCILIFTKSNIDIDTIQFQKSRYVFFYIFYYISKNNDKRLYSLNDHFFSYSTFITMLSNI